MHPVVILSALAPFHAVIIMIANYDHKYTPDQSYELAGWPAGYAAIILESAKLEKQIKQHSIYQRTYHTIL